MRRRSFMLDSRESRALRRRPLGRYRYVRRRWHVLFAVVDAIGSAVFRLARTIRHLLGQMPTAPEDADPRVILLIQLDHLGDAILSTPMLPALRSRYPRAAIEVLAGAWNREVFESVPEVDRVYVSRANRFARRGPARLLWLPAAVWWGWRLRRRKVDLGIDVRGEFPLALILWLCGARRRLGWDCGGGAFLLSQSPAFVPNRPEVESRWALLAELGIEAPDDPEARRPRFCPTDEARSTVARRLAQSFGWLQPFGWLVAERSEAPAERPGGIAALCPSHPGHPVPLVAIHVGAGTQAKQWPAGHWQELLGRIIVLHRGQVVLVGSREDRIIARQVLGDRPWPGVADWTGRLTLVELAALLEQADVLVGADSAPAHLAAAVDTPVVVLLSGTNSARQWRPCGGQVTLLRHEVECSPCHRTRCPKAGHPCMSGLRPEQVVAEVEKVLRARRDRELQRGPPSDPLSLRQDHV